MLTRTIRVAAPPAWHVRLVPNGNTLARLTILAVAVGVLLRVAATFRSPSLVGDDLLLALAMHARPFDELVEPLDLAQVAPLPFIVAQRLSSLAFGISPVALRLLPLVIGCAAVWAVARLAREVFGKPAGLIAAVLAATSLAVLRYSIGVKQYGLDMLVAGLLTTALVKPLGIRSGAPPWPRLAAGGALALALSLPAVFVAAAGWLAYAWNGWRRPTRSLVPLLFVTVCWAVVVTLPYRGLYATAARSAFMRRFWEGAMLSASEPALPQRLWAATRETFDVVALWPGLEDLYVVILLLWVAGLVRLLRADRLPEAICLATPPLLAAVASLAGRYPIANRMMMFAAPGLVALVAGGLAWALTSARGRMLLPLRAATAGAAIVAFIAAGLWVATLPPGDDYAHAVRILRADAGHDEPLYVGACASADYVWASTDWSAPDTARLRWVMRHTNPGALGQCDLPNRGARRGGEAGDLQWRTSERLELFGAGSGLEVRPRLGSGVVRTAEDAGWAATEADRLTGAGASRIWILLAQSGRSPDNDALLTALRDAGATLVERRVLTHAGLWYADFTPVERVPPHAR